MKEHKYNALIALATGFFLGLSLTYAILIKRGSPLDMILFPRYVLMGFGAFLYTFILLFYNRKIAAYTFSGMTFVAGLYLMAFMQPVTEGFTDLGLILIWMILMGCGIVFGLLIELFFYFKNMRNKDA